MSGRRAHYRRPAPRSSAPVIVDDPSKPIDEVLFGPRDTNIAEPTPAGTKESTPMSDPVTPPTSQVPATVASSTALATLPKGLEHHFTPEEWAVLPESERTFALQFFAQEEAATTDGVAVTFPRWKFPSSGGTWFVMDTDQPDAPEVKELVGIVIAKLPGRGYYEPGAAPAKGAWPLCSSSDTLIPDVVPSPVTGAKTCAACPLAQWGSGKDAKGNPTRGQACKLRLRTFFLRDEVPIPEIIALPPTSLKTFGQYAIALRQQRIPMIGVHTIFGLTKAVNRDGTEYSALTLRMGERVPFAQMKAARELADQFEQHMKRAGLTVDEAAGDEPHADESGQATVLDADGKPIPF